MVSEDALLGSKDHEKRIGSLKWIRSLMKDRNSKSPGRKDTNHSFKGKRGSFDGLNYSIQQPCPSTSSNPERGPPSYGLPNQRQPRPSASSISQRRPPSQAPALSWHQKSPCKQTNGQIMQSNSSAPHPKPLPRDPSLVGFGSGVYGPYGPRGDHLKRPRGNISGQYKD